MDRDAADEVLRTLFADVEGARATAETVLVPDSDPYVSSIGHQVLGIVLRDEGATAEALAELRTALRVARRCDDPERWPDAMATLGATLATAGRIRDGLRLLERAEASLDGVPRGRVLVRRAWVLGFLLARFEDSAADLRTAGRLFAGAGDRVWEARALNLEGIASFEMGDLGRAASAFEEVRRLCRPSWATSGASRSPCTTRAGSTSSAATSREPSNVWRTPELGSTPWGSPASTWSPTGATSTWPPVSLPMPSPSSSRRSLPGPCNRGSRRTCSCRSPRPRSRRATGRVPRRQPARRHGCSGPSPATSTGCGPISCRSPHVLEGGDPPARLLRRAERLVAAAREARIPELPQALIQGARLATRVRSPRAAELATSWLEEAARFRNAGTGGVRALGWYALAQHRWLAEDAGGVLRACDRGLAALDEHRATLGSQELRASSSGHGAELAELGTRTALASGDARRLLRWSERWRATSLAVASATSDHDPETTAELAALRAVHRRLAEARAVGERTEHLQARATRLEQTVRQHLMHARGTGERATALDVGELLDGLAADDAELVELTEIDGALHALVVGRGRVRHLHVGEASAAAAAVDFALFSLRQAARGRRAQLDVAGARLQRALLGAALDGVGESRVVVSGTSALQGVPWGLLPALAHRPVTSTPSARLWLRSRSATAEGDRRVMLVGPGLGSGGAEVPALAAQDPEAQVIDGEDATVAAALAALDGAALAHVAAHGHFRDDSPLFSSLALADGPLLVHDLQGLKGPPHRVVLSACESGVMAPVGDQELLGLAAALLSMGTAGVVSSLAEVDDAATVEVMVALHTSLRAGGGLGEALLAARQVAAGDPVLAATAASFTVLGT